MSSSQQSTPERYREAPSVSRRTANVPAPTRPELLLLLTCMRPDLGAAGQRQLDDLLARPLDWDYLLRLAVRHGARPLMAKYLLERAGVPENVAESLRQFSLQNTRWNLRLAAELVRLSAALEAAGVRHVIYKGPVLSEYLYATIGLRESCDLDLLVRPEQLSEAITCVEDLRFVINYRMSPLQRNIAVRIGVEFGFARDEVALDLHWRLGAKINWPVSQMDKMWQQLVPFAFCGRQVNIFSPEAMLASLCVHAAQHHWIEVKMFADIAELLRKHAVLDWPTVKELVQGVHTRRSMCVSLQLAHAYLGAGLPDDVMGEIARDPQVSEIAAAVSRRWAIEGLGPPGLGWLLFTTRGERAADRWRYIRGVALRSFSSRTSAT